MPSSSSTINTLAIPVNSLQQSEYKDESVLLFGIINDHAKLRKHEDGALSLWTGSVVNRYTGISGCVYASGLMQIPINTGRSVLLSIIS